MLVLVVLYINEVLLPRTRAYMCAGEELVLKGKMSADAKGILLLYLPTLRGAKEELITCAQVSMNVKEEPFSFT